MRSKRRLPASLGWTGVLILGATTCAPESPKFTTEQWWSILTQHNFDELSETVDAIGALPLESPVEVAARLAAGDSTIVIEDPEDQSSEPCMASFGASSDPQQPQVLYALVAGTLQAMTEESAGNGIHTVHLDADTTILNEITIHPPAYDHAARIMLDVTVAACQAYTQAVEVGALPILPSG